MHPHRLSNSNLNEVVVIGYGTQLKKDLTGSVASVNAKDFQKGAITSIDQLIAGKIAGVSVTSNGGQPGSSSTIRIRGLSSINGNNDPLYVLDGMELPATTNNGINTTAGIIKPAGFSESGRRRECHRAERCCLRRHLRFAGSAGVIMINTKRGAGGSPVFNFNTSVTAGTIAKYLPVLNAGQFRNYVDGQVAANPADSTFADMMGGANTNWQKLIYQTAIANNDNISISGAAGMMPYRVSLGYHDETGILKTDNLQRGTDRHPPFPTFSGQHAEDRLESERHLDRVAFCQYQRGRLGDGIRSYPVTVSERQQLGRLFRMDQPATGALNALATKNPLALLRTG